MPRTPVVIDDTRGGRNGTDPPLSLPANQCTEMLNVDWRDTFFAHKRGGSTSVSLTGGSAFATAIYFLSRFVPGADETLAELFAADVGGTVLMKRLAGGTSWANVTLDDAIFSPQLLDSATLNGKLFLAFPSAVDRMHAYDPGLASPRVRRHGITPSTTAATVANTGAGAYAAVIRYYRVRFRQYDLAGLVIVRQSEPTPVVSFTPSGTGTAARVTRPTAPGEGETHWVLEASPDNVLFYVVGPVAIATTTADDIVSPASYSAIFTLAEAVGLYTLWPSVKYLLSDGNRLLGLGAHTTGQPSSRVWHSPVLGSTDHGDDERLTNTVTLKGWTDLNEKDGDFGTGLGGPLNGVPYAFKYRSVWKLRPTGDLVTPYLPRKIRDDIGCIAHKTIAIGEDSEGDPCLYFLSHRGPYRITASGVVQYLGRDNEDIWRTINLEATVVVGHSKYYPDRHQWWLWIATTGNNSPNLKMMFDVQNGFPDQNGQVRGGWVKHTGLSAEAIASVLFANTVAAAMSRDLKPYVSRAVAIHKCDTSDADDSGTSFQGTVTTRHLLPSGNLLERTGVGESMLATKAQAATTLTVTINRDYGVETRALTVSIAPAASETRVTRKVEGSELSDASVLQMTVGDSAASTAVWTIDALVVPVLDQGTK